MRVYETGPTDFKTVLKFREQGVPLKVLWEILVPKKYNSGKKIPLKHHLKWDSLVRKVTGSGLTIHRSGKGMWVSPTGTLFTERMIPVRVTATHQEILDIANMTVLHYQQEAVMYYKISDEVHIVKA